ncbi:MAG TPA: TonB family protein [Vicinamibacterales bacterium]|nr:TonB family protein [Vicinamibacterales bacterium]
MASGVSGAAVEMCQGNDQKKGGDAAAKGSPDRARFFTSAIDHSRRAATLSREVPRRRALDAIAALDDAQHLNDLDQMDRVLRKWIALAPDDLSPVFRLAKLREDRGFLDAAEDTLLLARHQKPEALDPYKMLAQFYARRATAIQRQAEAEKPKPPTSGSGEPDEQGIYRVAGIQPPLRLDRAVYPPEAMAAGVDGNVVAEIVVNESGDVKDASVLRSVPMLDEAALKAVRNWHFEPTLVNEQAVPVRMTVTVTFTTR